MIELGWGIRMCMFSKVAGVERGRCGSPMLWKIREPFFVAKLMFNKVIDALDRVNSTDEPLSCCL